MSYKVTAKIGIEKYRTEIIAGQHRFILDEPLGIGGKDLGKAEDSKTTIFTKKITQCPVHIALTHPIQINSELI